MFRHYCCQPPPKASDKAATIARCQATKLGWLVAVPANGILEEHSRQSVCTSGPSCSRLPERPQLEFLRMLGSSYLGASAGASGSAFRFSAPENFSAT